MVWHNMTWEEAPDGDGGMRRDEWTATVMKEVVVVVVVIMEDVLMMGERICN